MGREIRTILITGGCGFIGSNFVRYMLRNYDYTVINVDKLTYAGNLGNLSDISHCPNYEFVRGDIADEALIQGLASRGVDAIINFAAESHVDRSIEDSRVFIETNVLGTQVLLEAARKYKVSKFLQISCYDDKSRALTDEGLKAFNEVRKGDRVLSLNPHTNELEFKRVNKVIVQDYDGPMIHFSNRRVNICVTPNHNMFLMNTAKPPKLVLERADQARQRSFFRFPKGKWIGKDQSTIKLGEQIVKTEDFLYLLGFFIGDGFLSYQEKNVETKSGLKRQQWLNIARNRKGQFEKIGKQSDYKSLCHSYRVFIDVPQKDLARHELERILSHMNIRWHSQRGKAGEHIYFTSKSLFPILRECGDGAYNKRIPRWALEYAPKYLKRLLQGLLDSDGNGKNLYTSVSKRLLSDICELGLKLGFHPKISREYKCESRIATRRIQGKKQYVFLSKSQKGMTSTRSSIIHYSGKVWCLQVEDNRNFVVERNGKLDICGNTDEVYGSLGPTGAFTETSPLAPNSPYSASKTAADLLVRAYHKTYGLPSVITRCSNNYGPYQFPEKLIPLMISNALEGNPLPVYGDGMNVRDWIFVEDHCRAIDLIMHKGKEGEVYNVGGNNEVPNIEIVKIILKRLNKPESLIKFVEDRPGHDRRYAIDSTKLRKDLGWDTLYPFEEAMDLTVRWYVENQAWWKKVKSGEYLKYYERMYGHRL